MTQVNNFAALIAAVNATRGKVMDDHGGGGNYLYATGIAELVRGETKIPVLFCDSKYFSLNRLYLGNNGEARVSRDSVGGVVELFGAPLSQGIATYNEKQQENLFTSTFLSNIHEMKDGVLVATNQVSDESVAEMQKAAEAKAAEWKANREPVQPMTDTYRASGA